MRSIPERSGIARQIKNDLLGWKDEEHDIRLEAYKLNIYGEHNIYYSLLWYCFYHSRLSISGKGCFFKSHKDTPRSEGMFGSLVVILPVSHDGGELRLCHNERETVFDSAKALNGEDNDKDEDEKDEKEKNAIAYVAFYSDVEHEVLRVTSGYRITLTYNLHFITHPVPSYVPPSGQSALTNMVRELLEDPEFLPKGAYLGFGLKHQYPVGASEDDDLAHICKVTKGADEAIVRAWKDCGLEMYARLIYDVESFQVRVMCS